MTMNINEIKVNFKFIEAKKLKAIVSLEFNNFVVRGFRIQESNYPNAMGDNLWLAPPSYPDSGGKYHPIFFMTDKEEWKKLEQHIWEQYALRSEEFHKKRFGL